MVTVVRCKQCNKRIAKKPKYTIEKREGHLCNSCWSDEKIKELVPDDDK